MEPGPQTWSRRAISDKIGSMLKCLIALTSLLATLAGAQSVYTWVDANGQRHYSDRPVDGATPVQISESQTFSNPPDVPVAGLQTAAEPESPAFSYSIIDVVGPAEQETLWNIATILPVELAIFPALRQSDRIDLILDGGYIEIGARTLSLTVSEVYRGEHTLQAVIVDGNGDEVGRSATVTFFVRQNSIIRPN